MSTIFTAIIKNEISSFKIYEDELCVAILDINPISDGHSLIIPKVEVDEIYELDSQTYSHIFEVAKNLSLKLKKTFNSKRVCYLVEGFEIAHAHIHLIPCNHPSELSNPRVKRDEYFLENIKSLIENS
jgi:histidine triad (HIT) family protein